MTRVSMASVLALGISLGVGGVAVSSWQPPASDKQSAAPAAQPAPEGIVQFSRVDATVACGGSTEPAAFEALAAEGFRSVINLRMPGEPGVSREAQVVEDAGLRYVHIPFDGAAPDPAVAERFLEVIADPSLKPVFIHCASANRVGAMWAIKRVVQDGWPREKALEEARTIGLKSPALEAYVHQVLDSRR